MDDPEVSKAFFRAFSSIDHGRSAPIEPIPLQAQDIFPGIGESSAAGDSRGEYLHISQGQGGLFKLPLQYTSLTGKVTQDIKAVGTTCCYTCVGVYVPVSDTHFFAAHIDAHNFERPKLELIEPCMDALWVLNDEESGGNLTERVKDMLREEFREFFRNHPTCSEGNFHAQTEKAAIIICPDNVIRGVKMTGAWVIEAICEFFGLHYNVNEDSHGFIKPLGDRILVPGAMYLKWPRQDYSKPMAPVNANADQTNEDGISDEDGEADNDGMADNDGEANDNGKANNEAKDKRKAKVYDNWYVDRTFKHEEPHEHNIYSVHGRPWTLRSEGKQWLRMKSYAQLTEMPFNGVE
ncbi:hypothetical protein CB0940_08243 [Cercospora beticola]|uniref:Uncharacterized protein n=1 Tax=Cercospora beticola TaxID=122368 RepID=A0A2G5HQN5_CERBT|nr:hypothetical protein CB0940_08243 [Cercospora beticola]PIA94857.1 hypothetical protein CB0940_08243 [Cercospora beticola]WPB04811.1 hypothetical protein RHO25_009458 [Cercospora beticola]